MRVALPLASSGRRRPCAAPVSTGRCRFRLPSSLVLLVLVLLPMAWLAVTSVRGEGGGVTLAQLPPARRRCVVPAAAVHDAVDIRGGRRTVPALRRADGLARVAHATCRASALLRLLILASFATPPFLGAFAWVLLGGPNAGLINQWYYALFGPEAVRGVAADQHLLGRRHGVRDGALHVPLRVHVHRQRPRRHSRASWRRLRRSSARLHGAPRST